MAPKAKSSSKDPSTKEILKYLKDANRPYSATDIVLNLGLKKTATTKMLQEMASDCTIAFKENGKQVIYYAHQKDDEQSPDDIQEMLERSKALEEAIVELKASVFGNAQEIQALSQYPDDSELGSAISEMNVRKEEMFLKLQDLQKQPMDPKEKDRINKSYLTTVKLWKNRKSKVKEIINELADKMEKNPEELIELFGIETDEDYEQSYEETSKYL